MSFIVKNEIQKDFGSFGTLKANDIHFDKADFDTFNAANLSADNVVATSIIADTVKVNDNVSYGGMTINGNLDVNGTTSTTDLVVANTITAEKLTLNDTLTTDHLVVRDILHSEGNTIITGDCTFGSSHLNNHTINGSFTLSPSTNIIGEEGAINVKRFRAQNNLAIYNHITAKNVHLQTLVFDKSIFEFNPTGGGDVVITTNTSLQMITDNNLLEGDSFELLFVLHSGANSGIIHFASGITTFDGNSSYSLVPGFSARIIGRVDNFALRTIKIYTIP